MCLSVNVLLTLDSIFHHQRWLPSQLYFSACPAFSAYISGPVGRILMNLVKFIASWIYRVVVRVHGNGLRDDV